MKRIASIVFILILAFAFSDCHKKKIPKDIPKWLQEIIKKEQKETGGIRHPLGGPQPDKRMFIEEYTDGSSTYYKIHHHYHSDSEFEIYNYDGVEVCYYYDYYINNYNNSGYYNLTFIRVVFEE